MQIEKPVSLWSKSTESRIPQYLDNFLFNFVQSGVRTSTQSLLHSLFKKGSEEQRRKLLTELAARIKNMNCVGRASEQIVGLVKNIIAEKCENTKQEQIAILNLVSELTKTCLTKLIENPNFNFYKFCEDMIDSGRTFKPHLFELNGCVKCYGDIQNNITPNPRRLEQITEQSRVSSNRMVYRLKMIYEIRDFTVRLNYKSSTRPPSLIIWYCDVSTGTMVRHGQYNSQPINLTTNQIQLEFENIRPGKCLLCTNKSDEQNIFCGNCRKGLEIELRYKMLGGDPEKIMKELGENYKTLMGIRKKADALYKAVTMHTTIKNTMVDVNDLDKIYSQIMLNLSLLGPSQGKNISTQYTFFEGKWLCFSCNYIQTDNLLSMFTIPTLNLIYKLQPKFIFEQLTFLNSLYLKKTLPSTLQKKLLDALASICLVLTGTDSETVTNIAQIKAQSKKKNIDLLKNVMLKYKELAGPEACPTANFEFLNRLYLENSTNPILGPSEKAELAVIYLLKREDIDILYEVEPKRTERLKQIKKLTEEQIGPILNVLNFNKQEYLKMQVTNQLLLLMSLLPVEMLPDSAIDMQDQTIIPFINCKLPDISHDLEIIMTPKPMVPLDAFNILPSLAKFLAPGEGLKLVKQILKFKKLWNLNLYNTLKSCDHLMETLQRDQQLRMCLQGLVNVYEQYFLTKIHDILVPRRRQFVIKIDPPEKQIKKYAMANNEQLQYQMIRVRELKTEDLPGYTMREVRNWITQQLLSPMDMDLIVEGCLINNVNSPIEMVYKKLVKPDDNKPVNPGQVDTFRVIYRFRGFFGEPTEKDAGNLGDDQKDLCLSYAPILAEPIADSNLCGLDILFRLFKKFEKSKENRSSKKALLQIMNMIFKSEVVRVKAIQLNYTDLLVRTTLKFLSSKDDDAVQDSHSLLETVSKLIDQASKSGTAGSMRKISTDRKGSTDMDIEQDKTMETAAKNVSLVLTKIAEDEQYDKNKHVLELVKLLPFSSKDIMEQSEKIYDFLNPFEAYQNKSKKLDKVYAFLEALPQHFTTFKQICYDKCLITVILESFATILPDEQSVNEKAVSDKDIQLFIDLTFLKSLVRGFQTVQKDLLERKLIPVLHKLSTVISKAVNMKIITSAEEIVNDLATKTMVLPEAAEMARGLIERQKQQNKKKAQQTKQAALEEMRKKRANAVLKNAIQITRMKKEYLSCVSCKTGYEQRNNLMGIYSYWTKQQINTLDGWWTDCKRMSSITSLTSFTNIHYQCHRQAQSYNSQEKKTEWQGAQARNCDARCNNWIPIRGPNTPDEEFDKISRKYFEHNKGGNFWVIINDLKGLMIRLAYQEDLAKDSNGSIPNNCRLIAVLVPFACSYMKKTGEEQKLVQTGMATIDTRLPDTSQQMHLYIVNSLFTQSWTKFQQWRHLCLKKISEFAVSDRNTYGKNAGSEDKFLCRKPLLVMLAMVQFVFENIHAKVDPAAELLQAIEVFVAQNLEPVFTQFEKMADYYKELVKKGSEAEFEAIFKPNN